MATMTAPAPERSTTRPAPSAPRRGPAGAFRPRLGMLAAHIGLVLSTGAGGVALAFSYASPRTLLAVLTVCAAASVVLALLLRSRFSALRTVLTGVPLPLTAVLVSAVWIPGEGDGALRGAGEALLHSGARILTSTAPTPLSVDTLTLPLLATWLTGTATALVWRAERRALALFPGLLLLVGAVVLNGPAAPPGFPSIALLGVAAVLVMSVRPANAAHGAAGSAALGIQVDERPAGPSRVRDTAVTGAICVLTATTAVFGGPFLLAGWAAEPGDPRAVMTPPLDPHAALNPLSYLPGWAAEPDAHLITVESENPVELRWVALADFTGTTWLPESGYRNADRILPAPVPPPPGAEEVSARITVGDDLPGSWAPVVGAPRQVGLDDLGYDALTGTVVTMDGDVAGRSYEAVGDVADWGTADPSRSAPPIGDVYDLYRDLPPGAPPILDEVVSAIASEGDYHHRARAIADYLRDSHTFDPETSGGHGYAHVDALLAAPGGQGGGGTSEQFASAFAMLARAAGLPSRVAVGFAPGTPDGEGRYEVRTGDAHAWGEVYFDGLGWVPFHVTPGGEDDTGSGQSPEGGDSSDGPEAEELGGSSGPQNQGDTGSGNGNDDGDAWGWAAFAAGIPITLVLLVPVLRLVRRARRLGSGPPADRVLGAWRELRDALRMSRVHLAPGNTVTETVAAARVLASSGTPASGLDQLADAVNSAGFGGGSGIDAAVAAGTADTVRAHQRALRRGRPRFGRLTWWFDPRPLFWRDGPSDHRRRRGRR
ncbi:transglutaminase-like domain-containing protein [Nocardiopsis ganjiahuensis]|uniref:transglutaminase-like domain-containing protein n=1 Tax=Nocardiopsis ganjiahuensis TaxID=239984 RepID=UPI00034B954E|nr:transglutaminase-like domain-containing protein [Nocardiopsis ganjiahuensis]